MRENMDIQKAARAAVLINLVQIVAVVGLSALVLMEGIAPKNVFLVRGLVGMAAFLVCWGAAVDIREARLAVKVYQQGEALREAYRQLEDLNTTMRAQRHDFLNHLQVVYSLIEMKEDREALDYIDRVYGDMQRVSRVLRTANAAVNALLQAKVAYCEKRSVAISLQVNANWKNLSMPGWEMCRVLGNLIDNALDALEGTAQPSLLITLNEDVRKCWFVVENNGPPIPEDVIPRLFSPGFTTKRTGQGMGLHIVKGLMETYGGGIAVTSDPQRTAFEGYVPHAQIRGV